MKKSEYETTLENSAYARFDLKVLAWECSAMQTIDFNGIINQGH